MVSSTTPRFGPICPPVFATPYNQPLADLFRQPLQLHQAKLLHIPRRLDLLKYSLIFETRGTLLPHAYRTQSVSLQCTNPSAFPSRPITSRSPNPLPPSTPPTPAELLLPFAFLVSHPARPSVVRSLSLLFFLSFPLGICFCSLLSVRHKSQALTSRAKPLVSAAVALSIHTGPQDQVLRGAHETPLPRSRPRNLSLPFTALFTHPPTPKPRPSRSPSGRTPPPNLPGPPSPKPTPPSPPTTSSAAVASPASPTSPSPPSPSIRRTARTPAPRSSSSPAAATASS